MTPHLDVGAYLLGALDDSEMARFEEHLAGCESCARDLDELSGLLPALDELRAEGIGYVEPPSGDAMLDRLLARVSEERRTRKRRRLVAVAAAAVLLVGGPAVAVVATSGNNGTPTAAPSFAQDRHWATNPATGASAVVGVADKEWGSVLDLRLTGVSGPLVCDLVVVGRDGTRQTAATWWVAPAGYGTPARHAPLTVQGASGLHKKDIRRFDVRTTDGTLLVSVPMT